MGLSSKSTTTTSSSNQDINTTPEIAPQLMPGVSNLDATINNLAGSNPQSYVPPASPLQTQAQKNAANLGNVSNPEFGTAANDVNSALATPAPQMTPAQMQAASLLTVGGGLQNYMNPELQDVVDTSLAGYDKTAGAASAALAAQAAGAGAFGGSRFGIQAGEQAASLVQQRAALEASLRSTAYNDATTLANEDADREQSANSTNAGFVQSANSTNAQLENDAIARQLTGAGLLGNLAAQTNASDINDVGSQDALGQEQRTIAQQQATAPLSLAQATAQLLGQTQPLQDGTRTSGQSSGTSTTVSNPSVMSDIGQGLQVAGSVAGLFAGIPPVGAGGISSLAPESVGMNTLGFV